MSPERGHRLQAVIEVETGESVNHLEALAQWAHFARLRAAFHLYVPSGMVDVARRLCEDNQIHVSEIWSYHAIGDEVRFTLVHAIARGAAVGTREPAARRRQPRLRPQAGAAPEAAAPATAPRSRRARRKPPRPARAGAQERARTQKRK